MNSLQMIEQATNVFTNSADAYELCRNLVHGNFAEANPTGAILLATDQRGQLRSVASYGESIAVPSELSLWDEHPISEAIQNKDFAAFELDGASLAVLPFARDYSPVGGMVLNVNGEFDKGISDEPTSRILSQLGAFYLETNGLQVKHVITNAGSQPSELSERQQTVLSMMALGRTNAEIARAMLLSESTIRQETVRIYRALGVSSRSEASKKGKALGLISRSDPAGTNLSA